MVNIPDVPPAIYEQAAQQDTQAQSQADRLAREAARRAVEQATVSDEGPAHPRRPLTWRVGPGGPSPAGPALQGCTTAADRQVERSCA